ncbi:Hypp4303 [Branchiostoma lanceolatum]|uniref:Hypp4303 protein n=1 Tax=Branchiostoma lanceolatum TaxID=7740 RepID=A0A8K0ACI6_BRALA|nr:Hypp4303 [Branchiostoma lanceolatum]
MELRPVTMTLLALAALVVTDRAQPVPTGPTEAPTTTPSGGNLAAESRGEFIGLVIAVLVIMIAVVSLVSCLLRKKSRGCN